MRCQQAQPLLAKQLREPLRLTEEQALRQHLAGCASCRAEAAELQRLEAVLQQVHPAAEADYPPVRVDTTAILRGRPRRRTETRWLPAIAASGLLAAAGTAWMAHRPAPARPELGVVRPTPTPGAVTPDHPEKVKPHRVLPPVALTIPEGTKRHEASRSLRDERPILRTPVPRPRRLAQIQRLPEGPAPAAPAGPEPGVRAAPLPSIEAPALQVRAPEPPPEPNGRVLPIAFEPAPEPAEETGTVTAAFQGDDRLRARLSLAEKDQPLGELLPRLGNRLHVRLTAGREVADDKVTLFLRARPAGEVLTLAARHLGFRWRRLGDGYELRQDQAGRQREQILLRNELQPIETQLNLAARWLQEPVERKKERVEEIDTRLRGGSLPPAEQARQVAEKQIVLDAWLAPATVDASLMLFRSLTPAQIDQMLAGAEFRYSTANGTLSPLIASRVHDSTSILETTYGPLPRLQADVTLSLSDIEDVDELPPSRRNRQLRLRTLFATVRGSQQEPHYWGGGWAPTIPAIVESPPAEVEDPDLKRTVNLTLPGPERQPPAIYGGSLICAAQLGSVWPRRATLAEVAQAIHQATGLDVVADSFVFARIDPALLRGQRPLAEVLKSVADELDYTWEKRGRLLLLRDRRFYRDRPAEVPERILQPFRSRVLGAGELSLDELAGLAASLSDTQARGMYRYWGWYLEDTGILPTDFFFGHRHHLRFWASLSPQQRKALRAGGTLTVPELLPAQRRLWVEALTSPPETARTPSADQRIPTPEEAAQGSFTLGISENQAALFVVPSPDGKRQPGSSIIVEGPPTQDIRRFIRSEPGGPQLELAAPPLPLAGYSFNYAVGGASKPIRKTRLLIAPLQKRIPSRPESGPSRKE